MKKLAFALVTVGFGSLVALGAAELYLRYQALGGFGAALTALSSGEAPYANLGSGRWVIDDPELSYRLNPERPGVNSNGIRHGEITVDKPEGLQRIVVLGDSVSWGSDGFVGLLVDKLGRRAEVINASVPGYTTHQERILLERELIQYRPDLVILSVCLNDNHLFLHRFDADGGMIWTHEAERALLPAENDPLALLPDWSYLAVRLRLAYLRAARPAARFPWDAEPDFAPSWKDEGWELFRAELDRIQAAVASVGGRLTVVAIPYAPQFRADLLAADSDYTLLPQRKLESICRNAGAPLLDLYPVLRDAGGAELLPDRIHLSEDGHAVVADALYAHLVRQRLWPER